MITYFNRYNWGTLNLAFINLGCNKVSGNNTKIYSGILNITSNKILDQCNLRIDLNKVLMLTCCSFTLFTIPITKECSLILAGKGGFSYKTACKIGPTILI